VNSGEGSIKADIMDKSGDRLYDVVIVGAGIVGAFLAYELSKTRWKVAVVEKELDVALGASKANSGIIHAGYDPEPGTLKARLNVEGSRLYEGLSRELSFGYKKTGSFVVALTEEEEHALTGLMDRGLENGVEGLELLSGEAARSLEPGLTNKALKVLMAHSTAVVDPWEVAIAALESAVDNGVRLLLNTCVTGASSASLDASGGPFLLETTQGRLSAKVVVNAAGVHAGEISALLSGGKAEFEIIPKRGQYFVLDRAAGPLIQRVIYPAPSALGKGVLVIPTLHGNIMAGPDNETLTAEEGEAVQTTAGGLAYVRDRAELLVPGIPFHLGIANFSGIRAESTEKDFIIRASKSHPGWIHAAGIKSPGLSAAPAIAGRLLSLIRECLSGYSQKPDFRPGRRPRPVLSEMTPEVRRQSIAENPMFSHIVCRCEMVSEAEVVDCIHRSVGARTLNGVKRRVRPGGGRCQGGFCAPRILEILSRELGIPETEVCLEHPGSKMVFKKGGTLL